MKILKKKIGSILDVDCLKEKYPQAMALIANKTELIY